MTIENPIAFCRSLWDWHCLHGCFGATRIRPTDIDGCVERNGHFLFIETKEPGVMVKSGQWRFLQRLAQMSELSMVIIVWGYPGCPEQLQAIRYGPKRFAKVHGDIAMLRGWVGKWYQQADADPFSEPHIEMDSDDE